MARPLDPFTGDAALPARTRVVVIGGGIIGVATALELAERGVPTVLCEKGVIGGEQSSRNWGWCRQQNRDARELPLATKALDLWEQFGAESGENTGFRRCGLFYVSNNDEELATWARWGEFARSVGVKTRMLTGDEATERGGFTGQRWKGGVHSQADGIANPGLAAPAVAKALIALGGTVLQGCAARGIETTGGAVSAVVTEMGTIRTRLVIQAGGAWASSFCRQLGVSFPQATVRQTILAVSTGALTLPDAFVSKSISITYRGEGCHTLAISGRAKVDPTLQFLRYALDFLPMFARRWRNPKLRGDIDLIAWHGTTLCIVEVKTRTRRDLVPAEMAVDSDKQDTLRQLARSYLRRLPAAAREATIRFDVVSIYLESPNAKPSHIELNQGAFGWA